MSLIKKYGIDFGTTNSSIALHYDIDGNGMPSTRLFDVDSLNIAGKEILPSLVYIDVTGKTDVGTSARREHSSNTLLDEEKFLISKIKVELNECHEDKIVVKSGETTYQISDIIALILKKLISKANKQNIENTDGLILGVPVNYSDICKDIMLEATVKAGLYKNVDDAKKHVEFMAEPIAVAVDYGINLNSDKNVFVFDFGGGTLDLAIVDLHKDDKETHRVYSKEGLPIGGEYYTELLFKKVFLPKYGRKNFLERFKYNQSMTSDQVWKELQKDSLGVKFLEGFDRVKCALSIDEECLLSFNESDYKDNLERNPKISCELTREEFEDAISETFEDIEEKVMDCLEEAGFQPSQIDEVLMAGGTSLIPAVIECVRNIFDKRKVRDPHNKALSSIVEGLAIKGYQLNGNEWVDDVAGSDYGIWYGEEKRIEYIISKNTLIEDTQFDRESAQGGMYRDVKSLDNSNNPRIEVYQGKDKLGEFALPYKGSGHYRVFYQIDKKQGWLTVYVYDTKLMHWYDDVLQHNKFKIN